MMEGADYPVLIGCARYKQQLQLRSVEQNQRLFRVKNEEHDVHEERSMADPVEMMDPSEFGLSARDPETYILLAVMDLIKTVGRQTLHTDGELSTEYLGMLSLYAIRRAFKLYGKGSPYERMIKRAYDLFDPDHMSEKLFRALSSLFPKPVEDAPPEEPKETDYSLNTLYLSGPPADRLKQCGVRTVSDLLKMSREEFRNLRSFGGTMADDLAELLENNGYKTKAMELAFPGCTRKEIEQARNDANSVLALPLDHPLGNRLYRNGIKTIDQLKNLSVDDLADLKDVSYDDILFALSVLPGVLS